MLKTIEEKRRYFAQSLDDLLHDPNKLEGYRYYQRDALEATHYSLAQKKRTRSYVQLPTNSGKTEIMLAMVLALTQGQSENLPRMFIVEPTKRLVRQTYERLMKRFPDVPVGLYYSDEQDLDQPLTIITWDSLYNLLETGELKPEDLDYLFLDEAHRGLSDMRRNLLSSLYDTTVIEGFTATSKFNDLKALYRTLGEEAYSIDDAQLIRDGYVSPRANVIVGMKVPEDATLQEQRRAYCQAVRDTILGYQDALEGDEQVIGHQNIIFNWTVDESKHMADLLNNDLVVRKKLIELTGNPNIIPAAVIHGGMKDSELNQIFNDYDAGKIMNLTGSRIPIEGIDTTARNVFTPERWSELETIQLGGRVRDSRLCRIFTICPEDSNKRKPVFYSDAMGAPRITQKGAREGSVRSLEGLSVSHPKIADNLTVYNTPDEVQSFISSREKTPQNKVEHFLGAAGMAQKIVAWRPEVEYIYKLLNHQHRSLPTEEKFCHLAGVSIPRKFLKSYGQGEEEQVVIQAGAASILQDMVGMYPEQLEATNTFNDIQPDLFQLQEKADAKAWVDTTKKVFGELEKAYADALLPWKYGAVDQEPRSAELPHSISASGITMPFHNVGLQLDGDSVSLAVHEDSLKQLWPDISWKTPEQRTRAEFTADLRVGYQNPNFAALWEEAKNQHARHPFAEVSIDGHVINCGTARNRNGILSFYIHELEEDWFVEKIKEQNPRWRRLYTDITDDMHSTLLSQAARTRVGATQLINRFPELSPLTRNDISNWFERQALTANPELFDKVLNCYRTLPDARKRIPITDPMRQKLNDEIDRTGIGCTALLNLSSAPEGLDSGTMEWWRRTAKEADEEYWHSVVGIYTGLPTVEGRVEYKPEERTKFLAEMTRTGMGPIEILKLPGKPESLTYAVMHSLEGTDRKTVEKDVLPWVLKTLEPLPDTTKVKITKRKRDHLNAERERTNVGLTRILESPNAPAGLTFGMTESVMRRDGTGSKRMEKTYYDFLVNSYAALPDADLIPVTDDMERALKKEKERADVGTTQFLSLRGNPHDTTPSKIESILRGAKHPIERRVWNWLISNYKALPDAVELNSTNLGILRGHMDRTGVGLKRFMTAHESTRPENLTASVARGWFQAEKSENTRTTDKVRWDFVINGYEALPSAEEKLAAELAEKQKITKTEDWLSREEFAEHIGRSSGSQGSFSKFWIKVREAYEDDSSENTLVDGHSVQCGEFREDHPGAFMKFCVHRSEAEWFKKQIDPVPVGWKPISAVVNSYFGNEAKIVSLVQEFRKALITEKAECLKLEAAESSESDLGEAAEEFVAENHMVEVSQGFYINPETIQLMEDKGVLTLRENLRMKQPHHLSKMDMQSELKTSYERITPLYKALEKAYGEPSAEDRYVSFAFALKSGSKEETVKSRIPRALMGFYTSHNISVFCVDRKASSYIREALGLYPERTDQHWTYEEAGKALKISPEIYLSPIYKGLKAAYDDPANQDKGMIETAALVGTGKNKAQVTIRVPRSELGYFQKHNIPSFTMTSRAATKLFEKTIAAGLKVSPVSGRVETRYPSKTDDDLTSREAAKILQVNAQHYTGAVYKALEAAFNDPANDETEEIEVTALINQKKKKPLTVKFARSAMKYHRQAGKREVTVFTLDRDVVTRENFSLPPFKTEGDMGLNQMASKLKKAPNAISPIYKALQQAWKESASGQKLLTVTIDGQTFDVQRALVGEKKPAGKGVSHFCCDAALSNIFAEVLGFEPPEELDKPQGYKHS